MSDDRALASVIILEFAVTLLLLSLLWGVLNEVVVQLELIDIGIVTDANTGVAAESFREGSFFIETAWEYTPVWGAVLLTLALQVAANRQGAGV
jgi:hypothetical protein